MAMGNKNKKEEVKSVDDVEFKVSMYCNACERTVAKVISKLEGVEKFTTDMNKHTVMVTGRIDPQKALKKLKKKTGKKVEMVVKNKEEKKETVERGCREASFNYADPLLFGYCKQSEALMIFSDENPNACSVM